MLLRFFFAFGNFCLADLAVWPLLAVRSAAELFFGTGGIAEGSIGVTEGKEPPEEKILADMGTMPSVCKGFAGCAIAPLLLGCNALLVEAWVACVRCFGEDGAVGSVVEVGANGGVDGGVDGANIGGGEDGSSLAPPLSHFSPIPSSFCILLPDKIPIFF